MNFNILEDLREEMELDEKMKLHLEKNEVRSQCYYIRKEVRDCAQVDVSKENVHKVIREIVLLRDLHYYIKEIPDKDFVQVYIFKHPIIREVLKYLECENETLISQWIRGKLFGYSSSEINKFLSRY